MLAQQFIRAKAGDNLLDVGCGTADILEYLPSGIHYFGVDQSREYIESANNKYGSRAGFICAELDAFVIDQLPAMDIVLAIGLLHHLDDTQVDQLLLTVSQVLRKGGRFVTVDPCFTDDQGRLAEWVVARDRGQNIRTPESYCQLMRRQFASVQSQTVHRRWIPYTHHFMVCRL